MIGGVLTFVRKSLDDYLHAQLDSGGAPMGDKVVFVDGDKMDPLTFKAEAVTMLVINVEEERMLRRADPYAGRAADGSSVRVRPELRLALCLLFVARFKQYDTAWDHLTKVAEYFQLHPVFDQTSTPAPPAQVEKLVFEFVTLRFSEQNEVWSSLKAAHQPSLAYRAKLLILRDQQPATESAISDRVVHVGRIS